jgi:hypothetical protein
MRKITQQYGASCREYQPSRQKMSRWLRIAQTAERVTMLRTTFAAI